MVYHIMFIFFRKQIMTDYHNHEVSLLHILFLLLPWQITIFSFSSSFLLSHACHACRPRESSWYMIQWGDYLKKSESICMSWCMNILIWLFGFRYLTIWCIFILIKRINDLGIWICSPTKKEHRCVSIFSFRSSPQWYVIVWHSVAHWPRIAHESYHQNPAFWWCSHLAD